MGLRTEHQADAKAQLVLKVSQRSPTATFEADDSARLDESGADGNIFELSKDSTSNSDVLESIRLVDGAGDIQGTV